MKLNQKGFSIIEVLVVVVIIGLIGAVGWLAYDRQKSPKQDNNTTQTPSPTPQTPATTEPGSTVTYLTLSDYKVRIPLNDKTNKLQLGAVTTSGYNESDKSVTIKAPELDSVWKCEANADGTKGTIGTISITTQAQRAGPGSSVATKKVGNYTYGFEAGGANCTDSPLYKSLADAFKAQFEQIQAY